MRNECRVIACSQHLRSVALKWVKELDVDIGNHHTCCIGSPSHGHFMVQLLLASSPYLYPVLCCSMQRCGVCVCWGSRLTCGFCMAESVKSSAFGMVVDLIFLRTRQLQGLEVFFLVHHRALVAASSAFTPTAAGACGCWPHVYAQQGL